MRRSKRPGRHSRPSSRVPKKLGAEEAALVRRVRQWTKNVEHRLSFLEGLKAGAAAAEPQWSEKMRNHHGQVLDLLLNNPPPGQERAVVAFRQRVEKV